MICVYAPTDHRERGGFFDSLDHFIGQWDCDNFTLFGDFNVVLRSEERIRLHGVGSASRILFFCSSHLVFKTYHWLE